MLRVAQTKRRPKRIASLAVLLGLLGSGCLRQVGQTGKANEEETVIQPILVTTKNALNTDNGAVQCRYRDQLDGTVDLNCDAVTIDAQGNKIKPDSVDMGISLDWQPPRTLTGPSLTNLNCAVETSVCRKLVF